MLVSVALTVFRRGLACGVTALLMPAVPAAAQARIIGVYSQTTGQPIPDATVRDLLTGDAINTSRDGAASLAFVTFVSDSGVIEIVRLGFQPRRMLLLARDTTPVTVVLEPLALLDAVVTTAPWHVTRDPGLRAGFERRCAVRNVACLRIEDWARRPAASLGDILTMARAAGVQKRCAGSLVNCHVTVGQCVPKFFLDGFLWTPMTSSGNPLAELSRFLGPRTVAGIEVFRDELTPSRFRVPPCGAAVVIWTRS